MNTELGCKGLGKRAKAWIFFAILILFYFSDATLKRIPICDTSLFWYRSSLCSA